MGRIEFAHRVDADRSPLSNARCPEGAEECPDRLSLTATSLVSLFENSEYEFRIFDIWQRMRSHSEKKFRGG